MRLLKVEPTSAFSLTKYLTDNERLRYAILSHTWGKDGDEVTYEDLVHGTVKNKFGYQKILLCAKQAVLDGIEYIWVDTCCIQKLNNSVELQHAINSMFRWYQKAEKCYVYLDDVPDSGIDTSQSHQTSWELPFRASRWFKRGWTLQELIAPIVVEFFSKNWGSLGSKSSLEQQICEITGIPVQALRGNPLDGFSSVERMSWAKNRQTKYEEDRVYSLLGIFRVYMTLNYGEGKEYALQRLNDEVDRVHKGKLPYSTSRQLYDPWRY
jgi:hypothetical protein